MIGIFKLAQDRLRLKATIALLERQKKVTAADQKRMGELQREVARLEKAIADEVALVGRVRSAKKALREHRKAR